MPFASVGIVSRSKDGFTWLVYINYYLDDGGLRVCGCAGCIAGEHAYDLEVVIVELGLEGVSGEGCATRAVNSSVV